MVPIQDFTSYAAKLIISFCTEVWKLFEHDCTSQFYLHVEFILVSLRGVVMLFLMCTNKISLSKIKKNKTLNISPNISVSVVKREMLVECKTFLFLNASVDLM